MKYQVKKNTFFIVFDNHLFEIMFFILFYIIKFFIVYSDFFLVGKPQPWLIYKLFVDNYYNLVLLKLVQKLHKHILKRQTSIDFKTFSYRHKAKPK